MSLFDSASLCVTPNGVKAEKLYSINPTDGSGDLSVTRATTATRVNSAGLIESVANNVPRLDYSNGSCPSILVEPQRTNLLTYSNTFTDSLWLKSGITDTGRTTISPDGTSQIIWSVSTSAFLSKAITGLSTSNQYSNSIWIKANKIGTIQFRPAGNTPDIITINLTTQWQRFEVIATPSVISGTFFLDNRVTQTTGLELSFYGAQLEAGANATSYIPTVASAVTRNADVISKTGISDLIGQTEGTIFVEFDNTKTDSVSRYIYAISSGNSTEFNFEAIINNANNLILNSRNNATTQVSFNFGVLSLQKHKIAYSYSENNTKIFVNGVLVFIDTLCAIPATDSVKLGMRSNNATPLNDSINILSIWKTQLTDQECINLTTL